MHTIRHRLAGEIVFSLLLVAVSLFLLWTAYGISGFSSITSAGAFPMFATLVMVISGVAVFVQTVRAPLREPEAGDSPLQQFLRQLTPAVVVLFTALIAAYMLLLQPLGFLLASYLFLVASMWLLGSRRLLLNLGLSAVCLAAIYLIFQTVFSVVLPTGTLLQGWLR
jgi:putative tricarboxylic transport membrane protein